MRRFLFISFFVLFSLAPASAQENLYSRTVRQTMHHGSLEREYFVFVPDSLAAGRPLMLLLHGYGGKAEGYRPEMLEAAERHGYAVCIPQGWKEEGVYKAGWNVRYPSQATMPTDDVDFVIQLARKVAADYSLNPENLFFSGMSNGGDLAYVIALEHPDVFSAIASVAGLEFRWVSRECSAHGPVPFMEIHGTDDKTSMWQGDPENTGSWGSYLSVPVAVGNMVYANKCEYEITRVLPLKDPDKPSRQVILHQYTGSPYGTEVLLYEVKGGKHSWHLSDLDTPEVILEFFERYIK